MDWRRLGSSGEGRRIIVESRNVRRWIGRRDFRLGIEIGGRDVCDRIGRRDFRLGIDVGGRDAGGWI